MCSRNLVFYFFYLILLILFDIHLVLYNYYEYIMHLFEDNNLETYDYIIVGCGTAGSLIANYLSLHSDKKILILEAGGKGSPLLNPPSLGPLLQGTLHDWQYESIEQADSCLSMSGKCKWPSGKILGGSAKLSNMIYMRNYADEIVSWFEEKYNLSYIETHLDELEKHDLLNEPLKFKTELSHTILNAAKELGFRIGDLNKIKSGFMETIVNQKNGARWSTYDAFLHQNSHNTKIVAHAVVEKLFYQQNEKTIKGVIYEKFGHKFKVLAKKGVILSAGAIGTPKILLLSGIGPKLDLEKLGIPVLQNLPVGENLMDHVTTGLDLISVSNPLYYNLENFTTPWSAWEYFYNGKGPWTSVGCEVIAIINTCDINLRNQFEFCNKTKLPDLQLMVMPTGLSNDGGLHLRKILGIGNHVWNDYFEKLVDQNVVSILPIVLHPKSKGFVKLRSTNPDHMPIINTNYFSHKDDVDVIIKGINLIKQLINTESAKKIGAHLNRKLFPGCIYTEFDTPAYWECYVKHFTLTSFHPAGTCQLGDHKKNSTVVDFNFKVVGVNNLFVADASVFPEMPSGNPNTAVALLAKLFVDQLISNDFKN